MEGKGDFQIRPKRGKSIVEDGLLEIFILLGHTCPQATRPLSTAWIRRWRQHQRD